MSTYIGLLRYTTDGIKGIKSRWEQGNPYERGREVARSLGCEVKAAYLTLGQYDAIVIAEAPDDETAAKLALATGMQGVWQTETLRAFTESEAEQIVKSLP